MERDELLQKALDIALPFIKEVEGYRHKAYRCTAGKWTIGYGRTGQIQPDSMTSQAAEDKWLLDKVEDILTFLISDVPGANPYQLAAVASFIYNVGMGAWKTSTLRKLMRKGEFKAAGNEFSKWIYVSSTGKKVIDQGLRNRRGKEYGLYITPVT